MARILKARRVVEDRWRLLASDQPLPPDGAVVVDLERFAREREALLARESPFGVRVDGGDSIASLVADLARVDLVVLHFASFGDGRGFSHARRLREQHGYAGEIRATGEVTRDHVHFMQRCGIDAVEVPDHEDPAAWIAALDTFSVRYQATADGRDRLRRPVYVEPLAP